MEDTRMECNACIEGEIIKYHVSGAVANGEDIVLLQRDDNLIHGQPWSEKGYTVAPFLSNELFLALKAGMADLLYEAVSQVTAIERKAFTLETYHQVVNAPDLHAQVIAMTRTGWAEDYCPIPLRLMEERISELLDIELTAYNRAIEKTLFHLRIVRPQGANDFNPPHRDVWLDRLRHCVNIYVPLAGSNKASSLPLVEGSHLWKESEIWRTKEGAIVNGLRYSVPSVVRASQPLTMVRPDPKENEVLLFTPYLIHGGGINLNHDLTRSSLEMRFWRK